MLWIYLIGTRPASVQKSVIDLTISSVFLQINYLLINNIIFKISKLLYYMNEKQPGLTQFDLGRV